MNRESPLPGQVLAVADLDSAYDDGQRELTDDLGVANLLTSKVSGSEMHKPVLDIDLPAKLLPSSTPGHFHLLIDREMSWEAYLHLLDALVVVGLIEPGYANASRERGHTAIRLPWIRKAGDQ
ncbi:hypothetical protein E0H26_11630 [Micromonospora zingiberis]|uniref:Uncharacterized protein n=1 Tax=Micromonospora zingiberis TaxID=2053011 RepID=A0A4R0GLS1_9ACTN|nr:hypothetical protein [Micromonospora zingiberis]TCB97562.1 hypothetical protein E0H26_11630 [Micromonospora zingiberis]